MCLQNLMKFHHCLFKILKKKTKCREQRNTKGNNSTTFDHGTLDSGERSLPFGILVSKHFKLYNTWPGKLDNRRVR